MKSAIIATAVLALIGSQALAAENAAPLAAGKPAGVQEAQRHHRFPLLLTVGAAALVVAGIVVAVQNGTDANCGACTVSTGTSP